MKKSIIAVIAIVILMVSCQKNNMIEDQPTTQVLPFRLKYNLADTSVIAINNIDSSNVVCWAGQYFIKLGCKNSNYYEIVFTQHDSGNIYFAGGEKAAYMCLITENTYAGYVLKAKADHNFSDFVADPGVLTDTTNYFTLKNKISGRSIKIPAQEFLDQGYVMIWYDVIQE